jgi:hypothetical protein
MINEIIDGIKILIDPFGHIIGKLLDKLKR